MSEKEQIEKLKGVALKRTSLTSPMNILEEQAREGAVDAMAAYGEAAIAALIEVSEKSDSSVVKIRALEWITKIKTDADR